jgi:hypothetical protein
MFVSPGQGIMNNVLIFEVASPIVFTELPQLVPPGVPEFRETMQEQHQWLVRISSSNIMNLHILKRMKRVWDYIFTLPKWS